MQISEPGKELNGNSLPLAADWQVEGDGGKRPPGSGLLKGGKGCRDTPWRIIGGTPLSWGKTEPEATQWA